MKEVFDANLLCPLCGNRPSENNGKRYTHREHIPPKCIFSKQYDNLITVPSCSLCNAGTSSQDEKFKVLIGIYLGRNSELWGPTLKTVHNEKKKKLKKELLNNISPLLINDQSRGIFGHKFLADAAPIKIVIRKIVRGLHWKLKNEILDSNAKISIFLIKQGENLTPEIQLILDQSGESIRSGSGEFVAQYAYTNDHKYASLWKICFYGEDCFSVIVNAHPE